ncbi:MAG: DUF2007 domain-containing protein [Mediterranea sp.]|jgi:hypothetical protein|nr:DUF2007 domain-containing protein [Mediterranea sp.]
MKAKKQTPLKNIFSGSLWEAEIVKNILENNGITSILKTGNTGAISPYCDDTTIMVSEEDYTPALAIMRDRNVSL